MTRQHTNGSDRGAASAPSGNAHGNPRIGQLVPAVYSSHALPRSTHTLDEVRRIEASYSLSYVGSILDAGDQTFVPVFGREKEIAL